MSDRNAPNLHHIGYKFAKVLSKGKLDSWTCMKRQTKNCKASACTKDVNGVVMMKLRTAEHSHEPDSK